LQILLPSDLNSEQQQVVRVYLTEAHRFTPYQWQQALVAFDVLKHAVVMQGDEIVRFPAIYYRYVEERYADHFIESLFEAKTTEAAAQQIWARVAGQIVADLTRDGLYNATIQGTHYLLAYCLYWWRAFTLGYALEIEIQTDLMQSGIRFEAHNLRDRQQRFSRHDIVVSGFEGDIKNSTYFLQARRTQILSHDFYITKVVGKKKPRILVVFIQADMWQLIDGDTLLVLLEKLADVMPEAAHIEHEGLNLTVIDYNLWKEKMRRYQQKERNDE
jgi:hypothetical protein